MKQLKTIIYVLSALCVTAIITSCDKESGVQEQYKKLFTDVDDRETPLYIWQTASTLIALIHWYDTEENITQYYIKAEPAK